MAETVTVTIPKTVGYSGKSSAGKSYIAKINGTDQTYIFSRDFIDTECTDKNEMFTARRKQKGKWTEAAALEPGLYERCAFSERSYFIIWINDGSAVRTNICDDRAQAMALMMDDGKTVDEARLATKPPKNETPATT